ncbi:hypothetical protein [Rhodopirellula sp. P2]|uniref:hypothetical protein n=1 Tax=Rhodopirellula sp. P2 TaxID=2127060 RepID=UPI002367DB47|nr:hypothetical protein [Rhodopirellula sp. P2]WDQ15174.1 hypothetical protein PSR62_16180 [Rhodopirellula sp. P2]
MKQRLTLFACCAALALTVGCGDSQPTNLAGDISDSEFDEYNRMLQESQQQMVEADKAMAKEMKSKR